MCFHLVFEFHFALLCLPRGKNICKLPPPSRVLRQQLIKLSLHQPFSNTVTSSSNIDILADTQFNSTGAPTVSGCIEIQGVPVVSKAAIELRKVLPSEKSNSHLSKIIMQNLQSAQLVIP